jgi:hypothetical protein
MLRHRAARAVGSGPTHGPRRTKRRGKDSNPRCRGYPHNGFRDRRVLDYNWLPGRVGDVRGPRAASRSGDDTSDYRSPVSASANELIFERVDQALERGKRSEQLIIALSVMIFLLGAGLIITGIALSSAAVAAPSIVLEAFLYWPIRQIVRIRKENIALATAPALIAALPPGEAATEMVKLLETVRRA